MGPSQRLDKMRRLLEEAERELDFIKQAMATGNEPQLPPHKGPESQHAPASARDTLASRLAKLRAS